MGLGVTVQGRGMDVSLIERCSLGGLHNNDHRGSILGSPSFRKTAI